MLNKNLNINHNFFSESKIIDIINIVIMVIFVYLYIEIQPISPDGELYLGLAKNILNGTGYYDTIRNDEIIPSIGHPLLIAFSLHFCISGKVFTLSLLIVSFLLLYFGLKNINLSLVFIPFLFIFINIYPSFDLYSIELSILLSFMLLYYIFTLWIRTKTEISFLFLFLFIGINIIIRPILLPFIVILFIFLFILYCKNIIETKKIYFRNGYIGMIFMIVLLSIISILSFQKYGDNRYISSTYSSIPLYCAWNEYINLKQNYTSSVWKNLDKDEYIIATRPLLNNSGWKERDIVLKNKALEFLLNKPYLAIEGYIWRLGKITLNADNKNYIAMVILSILTSSIVFFILDKVRNENKKYFFISFILSMYVVLISAVFIYVGLRYLLTPLIFLIFLITINLYILSNYFQSKFCNRIKL